MSLADARRRRLFRSVVGWLIVTVIFYLIGRRLLRDWGELSSADLQFDVWTLVLAVILLAVYMVGRAAIWHYLTTLVRVAIPFRKSAAAWFFSQLGKYLPGKVFLYLGRLHFYVREGRPAGPVSLAFGIELVGTFASSILTVLVSVLILDVPGLERYRWMMVVGLVVLIGVLHPRLLGGVIKLVARLFRRPPFEVTLNYKDMLKFVGIYVLDWLVFGLSLYVFINSFYRDSHVSVVYLAGAFSFASMIGMLAVFAPSGLGVREGLLVLFLSQVLPSSVAVVAALAARVWFTAVELLLVGATTVLVPTKWSEVKNDIGSLTDIEGLP